MGAIQSSIGGVIGSAIGAVGAAKVKDIADSKKETAKSVNEAEQRKKESMQRNAVIDKADLANKISMYHVEARVTQSNAFKERLEAVKTGNWKASRVKLKRRGGK